MSAQQISHSTARNQKLEEAIVEFKITITSSYELTWIGIEEKHNYSKPYRDIYVHSKIMIVDNAFDILGSANINERSTRHDTEIAIGACSSRNYTAATNNPKRIVSPYGTNFYGKTSFLIQKNNPCL